MKKIIAMAVAAVCLVSATFALDLELGGRAILGRNLTEGTVKDNFAQAKEDKTFDFGGGAYVHFALLGGLGIQAEGNYIKSSVDFKKSEAEADGSYKTVAYDMHTLDLAPMLWFSGQIWKIGLGAGVGPNFSIVIPAADGLSSVTKKSKEDFKVGLIAGADVKFYFTKHLGLVLSGRYLMDFKEKSIEIYGIDTGAKEYNINRKTFYGGLGLEFKLI